MAIELVRRIMPLKYFDTKNIKKILLIKPLGLGSVVLTMPSVSYLRKKYNAKIDYLTFESNRELIELVGLIDEVIAIRDSSIVEMLFDTVRALYKMWREKYDVVIDFEFFPNYTLILSYLSGARVRVGFYFDGMGMRSITRRYLLTHRNYYNYYRHVSEMFLHAAMIVDNNERLVDKEKIYNEMEKIRDSVIAKIGTQISEMYRTCKKENVKLLILNPNTGELNASLRKWPVENWIGLVKKLNEENKKMKILFIGGKKERKDTELLIEEIKSKVKDLKVDIENLAGNTSVKDLIALLNIGDVLITNDTGPMHLSALSKISVIALFGPETPILFAPLSKNLHVIYLNLYCSPCATVFSGKVSACQNNLCMKGISAAEVFKIYKSIDEGS